MVKLLFIYLASPVFSGWDAATAWANYCSRVKARPQHRELHALAKLIQNKYWTYLKYWAFSLLDNNNFINTCVL